MAFLFSLAVLVVVILVIGEWLSDRTDLSGQPPSGAIPQAESTRTLVQGASLVTPTLRNGTPSVPVLTPPTRQETTPPVSTKTRRPASQMVSKLDPRPLHQAIASYETVLFLDVETTGRSAQTDRIVELAMMEVSALEVAKWIHGENKADVYPEVHRFNPGIWIPPQVSRIHGITNERAGRYPILTPAFIHKLIGRVGPLCLIVGHNVSFDIRFLHHEVKRIAGFPTTWPAGQRHACTMSRYRRQFPGQPYGLDLCLASVGLAGRKSRVHRGGEDVVLAAQLLVALARKELEL